MAVCAGLWPRFTRTLHAKAVSKAKAKSKKGEAWAVVIRSRSEGTTKS